ncbi:zinc-binding dehydrogenase-domain-containing protein [Xylariaceae sp. FL0016]|nr:zinc-binding dehydrogenase-domain-containing protein [Xylariaceae sp. FL0016]
MAVAAGARVIATTSSGEKAALLKEMGVEHVIDYNQDRKWGATAKGLTPQGEGVHHVVEVGGESSMAQSLQAVRVEGVISIVGFLGTTGDAPKIGFSECLKTLAIVRGISVGSREQFRECSEFIDKHRIKPFEDKKTFEFEEASDAFRYLWDGKHVGKVVIKVGAGE